MGEVEHQHLFWHFFLCEDDEGEHKVFEDPFYPVPEHFADGYECVCGATPSGVAP